MVNKSIDGFFLIDKPINWTSQDVCNKIKHCFHLAKVGHSGTLDPFATGLLIVACNNATKLLPYVGFEPKKYIATLKLGVKTSTGDTEGEIISTKEVTTISEEFIKQIFDSSIGEQEQIPPMTSAVHVNGVKLYELAHQGIEIERKPRKISVFSLNLIKLDGDLLTFECAVSSGTYVRVLGEDLAVKLGTVGHLISLRRIQIDKCKIEEAKTIEEIEISDLFTMDNFLHINSVLLNEKQLERAIHGNPIIIDNIDDDFVLLLGIINDKKEVIAIYRKKNDKMYVSERGIYTNGNI